MASPTTPPHWPSLAEGFDAVLAEWPHHIDSSWASSWPVWASGGGDAAARRIRWMAFARWCGAPPGFRELDTPLGRWCLLPRDQRLARLCALALALRPGVWRSCVRRDARRALAGFLGPASSVLASGAHGGACVNAALAERPPVEWAWVGHADITRAGAWPTRGLRRWARLGLPRAHPVVLRQALAGAADRLELEERVAEVDRCFEAAARTQAAAHARASDENEGQEGAA